MGSSIKKYLEFQTHEEVTNVAKFYPSYTLIYHYNAPVSLRIKGFEERNPRTTNSVSYNPIAYLDSIRRSKTKISDLVLCNEFDLFCTFTFKSDRSDVSKCKTKMSNWLQSQQKLHGKFEYLIVPEFHSDGESIHFHALLKNYKGSLKYYGQIRGRSTYQISSYRSGFSSAVKIDNHEKVSSYIKKYITKDMPMFLGKKRYWRSRNLLLPKKIRNPIFKNDVLLTFEYLYITSGYTVYKSPYILLQ